MRQYDRWHSKELSAVDRFAGTQLRNWGRRVDPNAVAVSWGQEVKHSSTKKYAQLFLENGADGLVFGFLNPDKTIDQERTKEFIELIHYYGASATLHKVIDITVDKHEALQTLHRLGIDRILTSPANYIPLKSDFRDIEIVAGGGIGEQNIASLLSRRMKSLHFLGEGSSCGWLWQLPSAIRFKTSSYYW